MTTRTSSLRAARHAQGWSQADAARALADLARTRGVPVASLASLKTQLSRWENGHATPEAPYRALLAELYGGWQPAPSDTGPAERLRARLAAAASVDGEVVALWHTQLATAQQLDDRLGAAGAAGVVRALVDQLDGVLPYLPDPGRRRPVAALLARACLLAGAQALDEGDPDAAFARFTRAADAACAAGEPDLALAAVIGHADVLVDVGVPPAALAVLQHAGVDLSRPPPEVAVEIAAHPTPEATVESLTAAVARGRRSTREQATLHAELANVLRAAGRGAEAEPHERDARALAARIGARRALRRLGGGGGGGGGDHGFSAGSAVSSSASAAR